MAPLCRVPPAPSQNGNRTQPTHRSRGQHSSRKGCALQTGKRVAVDRVRGRRTAGDWGLAEFFLLIRDRHTSGLRSPSPIRFQTTMSDPSQPLAYTFEVVPRPEVMAVAQRQKRPYWLHLLLLLLTILTTLIVGAQLYDNFLHGLPPFTPGNEFIPLFHSEER